MTQATRNFSTPDMIHLILFDVDGVLTDGRITYDSDEREIKTFHARDGFALKNAAQASGLKVGILTSRKSEIVARRAGELGIELLIQGSPNKSEDVVRLMEQAGIAPENTAFVGDDLIDLPAFANVGYPIAVADAADEVRQAAAYITQQPGGQGAARDAIEHLLKAQGKWAQVIQQYTG